MPVNLSAGGETETGGRAGIGNEAHETLSLGNKHPGRYSDTAAGESATQTAGNSNHTSSTVNQLYSKPRQVQSSWSKGIFRTMITLLLLTSVWKVDGNTVEDCRESAFKIHSFDCSTPTMINRLHLPEVCFIPEKKLAEELAAAQPAWILGEEYIHELSLPTLKYLEHQNAKALLDLNNRVEHGGCTNWLNLHNDKDCLHPLRGEPELHTLLFNPAMTSTPL